MWGATTDFSYFLSLNRDATVDVRSERVRNVSGRLKKLETFWDIPRRFSDAFVTLGRQKCRWLVDSLSTSSMWHENTQEAQVPGGLEKLDAFSVIL